MYYTCEYHEEIFKKLIHKYKIQQGSFKLVVVYLLTATNSLRAHINDCYDGKTGCIKLDALNHTWLTGGDESLIRLAFHLYTYDVPLAERYLSKGDKDRVIREMMLNTPGYLLSRLDDYSFEAAIEAIRMWRARGYMV